MAEQDDITIGEIGRTVHRIEANMVTKEANTAVIQGLIEADKRNDTAIITVETRLGKRIDDVVQTQTDNEKTMKSAASARVNMWIVGGISMLIAIASFVLSRVPVP